MAGGVKSVRSKTCCQFSVKDRNENACCIFSFSSRPNFLMLVQKIILKYVVLSARAVSN